MVEFVIRVRRLLPFLLLGPITGPLAMGLTNSVRLHRPWMASLYAVGIAATWVGLPAILAAQLNFLAHH